EVRRMRDRRPSAIFAPSWRNRGRDEKQAVSRGFPARPQPRLPSPRLPSPRLPSSRLTLSLARKENRPQRRQCRLRRDAAPIRCLPSGAAADFLILSLPASPRCTALLQTERNGFTRSSSTVTASKRGSIAARYVY